MNTGPNGNIAIAADIGGTHMRAAIVTADGKILERDVIDTRPDDGIEVAANRLADLVESINPQTARGTHGAPVGMGISTAGPLDPETGVYKNPPNLGAWDEKSMKPTLAARLGLPVHIGHDATLAAFAETRFGPHRGAQNLVYVTISTGVGGGIIANGEMVTGSEGHAGEVGHITVQPGAQSCNVGCDGCFEGNASGPAIRKAALARIDAGEETAIWKLAGQDRANVTSRLVLEAAAAGDPVAVAVRNHAIRAIGIGLGSLLNIFDPEALVVGGGVTSGLANMWDEVIATVKRFSLAHFQENPRVHVTTLGDDVSLLGAAGLAFRHAGQS
ncbi:MAG: ROK family protein [Chloroflexi bacterium]|nr:ROK family protein [Chloroflexota bacterium]